MDKLLILLTVFYYNCFSQIKHGQLVEPIFDATIRVNNASSSNYSGNSIYIINSKSIIYQKGYIRNYLNADINSFKNVYSYDHGHFAIDKNGVYVDGTFIKTDTTGFKIIGQDSTRKLFWKTQTKLFKDTEEVKSDIDIQSFTPMYSFGGPYYKDKNYLYYFDKKINGSDAKTAHAQSSSYLRDDMAFDSLHVYVAGKPYYLNEESVMHVNDIISKTSKIVIENRTEKVLDMDAYTIKGLSRFYSIDKNYVYWKTEKCPIEPKKFNYVKVWDQYNHSYVTDGISLYTGASTVIKNIDVKTFGVLPHSDFFYDKNGIYKWAYNEALKQSFNKSYPFKYSTLVSEKNTFISKNYRYIVYENQAYDVSKDTLYKDLSVEQIALLKTSNLTIRQIKIKKNDSFISFENSLYRLNDKIYWNNRQTSADATTFTKAFGAYYRDKNNLYLFNETLGLIKMEGIDAASAKIFNNFVMDKHHVYYGYYSNYKLINSKDVELLAIFTGSRPGCGLDKTPSSDYYLFKNIDGYWLVLISDTVTIRYIGKELKNWCNNTSTNFEVR